MAKATKNGNDNNESDTETKEKAMPAKSTAKKTAAKKSTAKKTAAKGAGRKTRARKPRTPAGPMPGSVKSAAATALAAIEEKLYDSDEVGVVGTSGRELKGARSGLMKRVKFDDGHVVTITVAYR